MPRSARKMSATGIYHVISRGNNKQEIYLSDEDYQLFLALLKKAKDKHSFQLYAYCLMSNHFHFLIHSDDADIGKCMHYLLTKYAIFFKDKYSRTGHLFQSRFKSEPVESDEYFLSVFRYIHQNPVKAKITRHIEEYPWSSYADYAVEKNIVDTEFAIKMMDGRTNLVNFMSFLQEDPKFLLGEEKTNEATRNKISSIVDIDTLREMDPESRDGYLRKIKESTGLSNRKLSEILQIELNLINRALRKNQTPV